MAYVYADMDALVEYQHSIIRTLPELEKQTECEEDLIRSTMAPIRRALEQAADAECVARSSFQQAEDALSDAQSRVNEYNEHLEEGQSPATVSAYYYKNLELKEREYASAKMQRVHTEAVLADFEAYVRSYRQQQESGIANIKKYLATSGKFFERYIQKLVDVKKCTNLSGEISGGNDRMGSQQEDVSGYSFPYRKSTFSEPITYTDPQTKQRVTRTAQRIVWENTNLDPNLVIPAGTQYSNGRSVQFNTTNLELMEQGKAPFILMPDSDGSMKMVPLELHHLGGDETIRIARYFFGSEKDGSLLEIAATTHDKYNRTIHYVDTPSFRRDYNGNKTADAVKFEKFRAIYWKNRAKKFKNNQE